MTATKTSEGRVVTAAVISQLMLMVDGVIVLIALPDIRSSLGVGTVELGWVVSSYALSFAALILLSGRLVSKLGARSALQLGVTLFTMALVVAGVAPSIEVLLIARAVQGAGAAIAAPSILVLITTSAANGPDRLRAMTWYVIASSTGSAIGLVAGGVLTEAFGWRAVMFVNIPIGVLILLGTLGARSPERRNEPIDLLGAVLAAITMAAAVLGLSRLGDGGGTDPVAYVALAIAIAASLLLIPTERKANHPALPGLLLRRTNALPFVGMALMPAALVGFNSFSVLQLQTQGGLSPVESGLSYLPWVLAVILAGRLLTPKLVARIGEERTAILGGVSAAGGIALFAVLNQTMPLWLGILVPFFITGLGPAFFFTPMTSRIMRVAGDALSGPAAALLQAMQQLGAAMGVALLTAIYSPLSTAGDEGAFQVTLLVCASVALALVAVLALEITLGPTTRPFPWDEKASMK